MTTPDLIGLRATIASEITAAKADYPHHHAALDQIGNTLDQIDAGMVPDFGALDAQMNGGVTAMIREDMRSIAEGGATSDTVTAGSYIRAHVIFIDKLRRDLIEWIAHKNRRMLDRKRVYNA